MLHCFLTATFARINFVLSFDANVDNALDGMLCPTNVCGRVEAVHQNMPEYAQYRIYDIKTASWVKECGRTVDFRVRVMVPPGKRFEKTRLPQVNCNVGT
jgi:hypothetical protein